MVNINLWQSSDVARNMRGPPGRGATKCGAFPLSCILVPLFELNQIAILIFHIFAVCYMVFWYPLIPSCSMLYSACCKIPPNCLVTAMSPASAQITTTRVGTLDLWPPPRQASRLMRFQGPMVPLLGSKGLLDRSIVLNGKLDAGRLPHNRLWAPKAITSAPQITANFKKI